MSGLVGSWDSKELASGQTGMAYLALKRPERAGLKWKDGYPIVRFGRVRAGMYFVSVGNIVFAELTSDDPGEWRWNWATNVQLYPMTASGGATTLANAKDQIENVIKVICGMARP